MPELPEEPSLNLSNIQGNILPGFKKDHQHLVFFRISDAKATRTWLSGLHPRISSAEEVLRAHDLWKMMRRRQGREPDNVHFVFTNIAISASGLLSLTTKKEVDQFVDRAFKVGMKKRSKLLGDPKDPGTEGHVSHWKAGGDQQVDLLFILASDDLPWLLEVEKDLETDATQHGLELVHRDHGRVREGSLAGHEHFGFKDGVSDPAVRGRWPDITDFVEPRKIPPGSDFDDLRTAFAAPGRVLVWPGHFLFGYGRQAEDEPREYNAEDKPRGPEWAVDGSFLVYRRLRQDVDRFERFVEEATAALNEKYENLDMSPERFGALVVGRWKSGTPVMRSPDTDLMIGGDAANYFQFGGPLTVPLPEDTFPLHEGDDAGSVCPRGAHIRKVNPRDETTDIGPRARTLPKLLLRRGITYDNRNPDDPQSPDDRGLLFVSYQSSIEDQFEFLTRNWVNRPDRPREKGGHDPILAQGEKRLVHLTVGDKQEKILVPGNWVIPTGGEYFFAPSVQFFRERLA